MASQEAWAEDRHRRQWREIQAPGCVPRTRHSSLLPEGLWKRDVQTHSALGSQTEEHLHQPALKQVSAGHHQNGCPLSALGQELTPTPTWGPLVRLLLSCERTETD